MQDKPKGTDEDFFFCPVRMEWKPKGWVQKLISIVGFMALFILIFGPIACCVWLFTDAFYPD